MKMPKIKFSDAYAKGSCLKRTQTAVDMNKQLFYEVYSLYKNSDYAAIRNIERTYKKFMPEPIFFDIKKLTPEELKIRTGGLITYFYKNKVSGYKITLKADNNKMHISELPTFMHESMHFLNDLLNPKHLKTSEKLREKGLNDIEQTLYNEHYYNNKGYADSYTNKRILKKTKKETKNTIKNLNPEDKILILNHIRELLQGEINAFRETQNYAKILKHDKKPYKHIEYDGYHKSYMFEEKLEIVNSILFKTIKNERCRIHMENLIKQIKKLLPARVELATDTV